MAEDDDIEDERPRGGAQRGPKDPREHHMYTYHANLAPKGPKKDWGPTQSHGKQGAFHKHHVGHGGHPGFDEELTLRWGPRERWFREKIQGVLEAEEEHKRKLASSSSDGKLRRKVAEQKRKENHHHFSNEPWRAGGWGASPQTKTPHNPVRNFSWSQAWSPQHLFSYFAPIEASESAVRMFEALGPIAQPDPSKVHVVPQPGSGHHGHHPHPHYHFKKQHATHSGEDDSEHDGHSPGSPSHLYGGGHSAEEGRPLLIAEDTIPKLGHRCFRPIEQRQRAPPARLARPQSAPSLRGRGGEGGRGSKGSVTQFAQRGPLPGEGGPRCVSHRRLVARRLGLNPAQQAKRIGRPELWRA